MSETETNIEAPSLPTCNCRSVVAYRVTHEDIPESDPETFVEYDVYESCGEVVNKGKEFRPGHDAKYKSVLIKAFRAGVDFTFADGGMLVHANPMELAKARGWEKFLTPAKPKKARKTAPAKMTQADVDNITNPTIEQPVGFTPCQVKIGRWWKDGIVTSRDGDQVTVSYQDRNSNTHETTVDASKVREG